MVGSGWKVLGGVTLLCAAAAACNNTSTGPQGSQTAPPGSGSPTAVASNPPGFCSGGGASIGVSGGTADCLTFAIVGDTRPAGINGTSSYPTAVITKIYQDLEGENPKPLFAVGTGDYMYASTTNPTAANTQIGYYWTARQGFSGQFFPTMGNHECTGGTSSNCGTGNTNGVTPNMQAFLNTFMQPLGQTKPYYSINVAATDGSWTAKFVFVAANAWDSTQASWLSSVLSQATTYTFVIRHEPTGTSGGPPGLSGSESIIGAHPITYRLTGHSHLYKNDPSHKQVINGLGGAPLTGSANYGYTIVQLRSDGALQFTTYDYQSHAVQDTFAIDANGNTVTGTVPTPTPSPTTTPGGANLVQNPGFESGMTSWTAAGVVTPTASTSQVHGGSDAALLGEANATHGATAPTGDSSITQQVSIPSGVAHAALSFWSRTATSDTIQYSWQEVDVKSASGTVLKQVFKECDNGQTWVQHTVDLSSYAGQTVVLYFNVHEDGYSSPSNMYVDDVSLTAQ